MSLPVCYILLKPHRKVGGELAQLKVKANSMYPDPDNKDVWTKAVYV
jgi:hypothetical protein